MHPTWADLLARRVILVTGKGGVGKTTLVATLARAVAARGRRVLCAEVAVAPESTSPLARAFGGERSSADEPVPLAPGIFAVILEPTVGHRQFLRDCVKVKFLADTAMKSSAIRAFLLAAPTFSEMGVLYRFFDLVREARPDGRPAHDVVIVDLPATGHAIGFAELPAGLLRMLPSGPVAAATREALAVVTDPARTAAVIITLPESLPVSESIELARGLVACQVPVRAVVLNRVVSDPFAGEEREHVERLALAYAPLLGARTLSRIDSAGAARQRLERELAWPVLTLPESAADGMRVPVALAEGLLARPKDAEPRARADGRP